MGHFWLTSFAVANVLIDIEVLYYLWRDDPPIHRYFHTYAGDTAIGLLAGLLTFGAVRTVRRFMPARWRWAERVTSTPRHRLLTESLVAGVIGGLSHVLLDSFMHHDINPLWPIADGNVLFGVIAVGVLHICLALSGFFGKCRRRTTTHARRDPASMPDTPSDSLPNVDVSQWLLVVRRFSALFGAASSMRIR